MLFTIYCTVWLDPVDTLSNTVLESFNQNLFAIAKDVRMQRSKKKYEKNGEKCEAVAKSSAFDTRGHDNITMLSI